MRLITGLRQGAVLLIFVMLGIAAYSNTSQVPFHFDDVANITGNPHIRITDLSPADLVQAGLDSLIWRRPVANISFALNYYFGGYDVWGYHVVNIAIHVFTGILFYVLARSTLGLLLKRSANALGPHPNPSRIALLAALVWLVHPIQTQSVTYIVQRMNSMAAMFYVLSLVLYVKGRLSKASRRRWPWLAGCVLSGLLALGSKEIAVTLPFFIWLYEWYFFQDLSKAWLKRSVPYLLGAIVLCFVLAMGYLGKDLVTAILSGYEHRSFTVTERVLTQFRVVLYYTSLLIFPHPSRLNLDYDFSVSDGLTEPITTLFSMTMIAGAFVLAILWAKRERLTSFCILWFLGNLIIESSIIGLELVYEHRAYLPSMFFFLMMVFAVLRVARFRWVGTVAGSVIIVVCTFWTYERNNVWRDPVTLWSDCVKKSPLKARPHNNLGLALFEKGKIDEAIRSYHEALRLMPSYAQAHNNLGSALAAKGDFEKAVQHYGRALRVRPKDGEIYNNWGVALHRQGRLEDAAERYRIALDINPLFAEAHNNLGLVLAEHGKLHEAVGHFSRALAVMPDHVGAHVNLGAAYHQQGLLEQAVAHYAQALRIQPDHNRAKSNMALAMKAVGGGINAQVMDH